jgi:uncharacterized protein (DUF983 family)
MARNRGSSHTCPECGQAITIPHRLAWWGGVRFRCPQCKAAFLAADTGSAAYYLRLIVPGLAMVALAWWSFEAVVRYGLERSALMLISALAGPVVILAAIFFMPRGAMKVERDQQFKASWLDRTALGRAFSGSEWEEKDGESGGRRE